MAIADVPDPVVSTVGVSVTGFDRLATLGAAVGCPTLSGLLSGALIAGIPDQVGGLDGHGHGSFAVEIIIGSGDPFACHSSPLHRVSTVGCFPDHLILTRGCHQASEAVGVGTVGCPEAPVGIERSERGGLDCEIELHWSVAVEIIIGHGRGSVPLSGQFRDRPSGRPSHRR